MSINKSLKNSLRSDPKGKAWFIKYLCIVFSHDALEYDKTHPTAADFLPSSN